MANSNHTTLKRTEKNGFLLKLIAQQLKHTKLSEKQQKKALIVADLLLNLIGVLLLVFVIRSFIISPFQVYGISMCNTFNYRNNQCLDGFGDYLIINKSSYLQIGQWRNGLPERGDVIVFKPPHGKDFYIKRIIGLPGETVKLVDGDVYIINQEHPAGVKLNETYLNPENSGKTFAIGGISEFSIPKDRYFVMGDNRQHSSDSRICFKDSPAAPGCDSPNISPYLSVSDMEGKAAIVLWPMPKIIESHQYVELDTNRISTQ